MSFTESITYYIHLGWLKNPTDFIFRSLLSVSGSGTPFSTIPFCHDTLGAQVVSLCWWRGRQALHCAWILSNMNFPVDVSENQGAGNQDWRWMTGLVLYVCGNFKIQACFWFVWSSVKSCKIYSRKSIGCRGEGFQEWCEGRAKRRLPVLGLGLFLIF